MFIVIIKIKVQFYFYDKRIFTYKITTIKMNKQFN